jgi:hypothetical protein
MKRCEYTSGVIAKGSQLGPDGEEPGSLSDSSQPPTALGGSYEVRDQEAEGGNACSFHDASSSAGANLVCSASRNTCTSRLLSTPDA